jgi:exodeoxyribonuclease-3
MKIISWNVNWIRAVLKKWFVEWVKTENPDILCLQEVKAFETQIPTEIRFGFQDYNYVWHRSERPWYAWTAIFYKKDIPGVEIQNSFNDPECFNDDWRVTSISWWDYTLFNIYFPNGWDRADWTPMLWYKLDFYEKYINHVIWLAKEWRKVLTTWDFNICHEEIDIARPKENENSIWFLPIERQEMDKMVELWLIDVFRFQNPELKDKYTWWSYRAWARPRNVWRRLDYFWVTENMIEDLWDMVHYDKIEGSDHCPIWLTIN